MKRSAWIPLVVLAGACSNTTGGELISMPFLVGGVSRDATQPFTFTTPNGWNVTLNQALVALGPFYFNVAPPDTSSFMSGTIIEEVTYQVVVDTLDPTLYASPQPLTGETGQAVVVQIGLLPPNPTVNASLSQTLNGGVAYVSGTASYGPTTVAFAGSVLITAALASAAEPLPYLERIPGAGLVPGGGAMSFTAQAQTLEMRVDPTHWFDAVDFSGLVAPTDGGTPETGPVSWPAASTFNVQMVDGLAAETGVYLFTLNPGTESAPALYSDLPDAGS